MFGILASIGWVGFFVLHRISIQCVLNREEEKSPCNKSYTRPWQKSFSIYAKDYLCDEIEISSPPQDGAEYPEGYQ